MTHSLRGRIEERRENLDVAMQSYQTAIELGDKRVSSYERLVLCLHRMGRVDEAEQRLSELVDLVPRSRTLSAVALSAAAKDQEGDRAVNLAKLGTEQRPGDALAWIWRGQLLAAKGQSKEAEECLRRAVEVAPNSVVAWNGLFSFYLKIGNRQAAREIVNELPNRVKQENSRVVLFQARGYEMLGDRKNAASMYETAVRLAPDNFEAQVRRGGFLAASDPAAAEKALRLALRIRPLSPRARRGLALVLASHQTEESWREARELLANIDQTASSLDHRIHAALLAQQPSEDRLENLRSARLILERAIDKTPFANDQDHLLLALVYAELSLLQTTPEDRAGMVGIAKEHFILLAARETPKPLHLRLYVDFLLNMEKPREAERWLEKLQQLMPEGLVLGSLRARWLFGTGRHDEITSAIKRTAQALEPQWKTDADRLRDYRELGRICASVEQYGAAERWYRKMIAISPDGFALLARNLSEQQRIEEAVD
ncbi:MAG: tetratricopeptide repeat protein, partial [Pirellulales bacterium]